MLRECHVLLWPLLHMSFLNTLALLIGGTTYTWGASSHGSSATASPSPHQASRPKPSSVILATISRGANGLPGSPLGMGPLALPVWSSLAVGMRLKLTSCTLILQMHLASVGSSKAKTEATQQILIAWPNLCMCCSQELHPGQCWAAKKSVHAACSLIQTASSPARLLWINK